MSIFKKWYKIKIKYTKQTFVIWTSNIDFYYKTCSIKKDFISLKILKTKDWRIKK